MRMSTTVSSNGAMDLSERCQVLERECEELRERLTRLENPPRPPRRRVRAIVADGLFVLLAGLVVAAIAAGVLVAFGVWKLNSEPPEVTGQAASEAVVTEQEPVTEDPPFAGDQPSEAAPTDGRATDAGATDADGATDAVGATDAAAAPGAPVHLVATAVGGPCWLQIRRGDADGTVLWEGILAAGDLTEFDGRRFWIRMGDPVHVRLEVNGEAVVDLPTVAADMVITEAGASVVATAA
jgi:hypothetical protein